MTAASALTLPTSFRAADGRIYEGPLAIERHRSAHLGLLHDDSDGYIEITPGTRPPAGKVQVDRRRDRRHYIATGEDWRQRALAHVARIERGAYAKRRFPEGFREEVFVGVAPRTAPRASKQHVEHSRFLWVDIDQPDELPRLWAFHAERPAHLIVMSGGSGGAHAYWRLAEPLAARREDAGGHTIEWIERANQRLIEHFGSWTTVEANDGREKLKFIGADRACADRSRVLRLAGTVNHKTGRYARLLWFDLALAGYDIGALVGDLPDMPDGKAAGRKIGRPVDHDDPYKRIAPAEYFRVLARIEVPHSGFVRCPSPHHDDRTPSCMVGDDAEAGFYCYGCGDGGAIYDLASLLEGGPTGSALRGEAFRAARRRVHDAFGDLT